MFMNYHHTKLYESNGAGLSIIPVKYNFDVTT
jgi:hypothetical protein